MEACGTSEAMSDDVPHGPLPSPFAVDDAEGLLWTLAAQVGDCVKLLDLDGRVLQWNAACERLYGWRAAEVVGQRMPHVPEELRLRSLADIRAIAAAGRVVERETEAVRSDLTRIVVRLRVVPVLDTDGHPAGVLSIAREVSADERLEWQRGELAAFIGRRLSQPLASIVTSAQLLMRPEIGRDDARRQATASSVARTAFSAARLVDNLAIVAGLTRERLTLSLESVDAARLVTDVAKRFPGERILVDFDPAMKPALLDRRLLENAVEALLGVALHATPEAETVSASVHRQRGRLRIEICDRGPVPDAAALRRMMQPTYSLADVRGGEGGGLAFALAVAVAGAHGGTFSVGPVTPAGARFTIEFDSNGGQKRSGVAHA